jgi:hypothetical protein
MEIRMCPKCNNPLKWIEPYHIVPLLPARAIIEEKGPAVSLSSGYPVEIWACQTCRYVEMYAAGRKGTEE